MILTPNTSLQAVNEILGSMGEAPINTIEEIDNVDAQNALNMLTNVTEQIEMKGWTFNQVDEYTLTPDKFKKVIPWDSTLLVAQTSDGNYIRNQGGLVFDVSNNTSVFEAPLTISATFYVPFEEMPSVFRQWATVRTARLFVSRFMGDPDLMQELTREEQECYRAVMEYEMMLEGNSMSTNPSVQSLTTRS